MKVLPILALVITSVLTAQADVVIEQKVESTKVNGIETMKIKGDLVRMEMPNPSGQATVLLNLKTGEATVLSPAQKIALKTDLNATAKAAMARQKAAGNDLTKFDKPKATGVTEKIGDYTADVYEYTLGQNSGKIWAAKDFPNADVFMRERRRISQAFSVGFDTSKIDVPGVIVKVQIITPTGTVTKTLITAKEQDVPETEFAVPDGYAERKLPTVPEAAPAAGK